eukprot:412599_1
MAHEAFGNERQCKAARHHSLNTCQAINRIKIILYEFNDDLLHKHERKNESNFMDKFAFIFISNRYTNISLLNDFHHIKYMHHVDDDDDAFSEIYHHFIDGIATLCNEKQCRFIIRRYRDRSVLQNDYTLSDVTCENDEYNAYD